MEATFHNHNHSTMPTPRIELLGITINKDTDKGHHKMHTTNNNLATGEDIHNKAVTTHNNSQCMYNNKDLVTIRIV